MWSGKGTGLATPFVGQRASAVRLIETPIHDVVCVLDLERVNSVTV